MSFEAYKWAMKQDVGRSSTKFVLVALSDRASDEGICWPSIETIAKDTLLDRKTVIKCIKELIDLGFLQKTGNKKGSTQKIQEYKILINSTKNGTIKQYQNWGDITVPKTELLDDEIVPKTELLDGEIVPIFPENSTKNGTIKQYQKRYLEPISNRTYKEPINKQETSNQDLKVENVFVEKRNVSISKLFNSYGIRASPQEIPILELAKQDVALETIEAACLKAKERGKATVGYVVGILRNWKDDAEKMKLSGAKEQKRNNTTDWVEAITGKGKDERRIIDIN